MPDSKQSDNKVCGMTSHPMTRSLSSAILPHHATNARPTRRRFIAGLGAMIAAGISRRLSADDAPGPSADSRDLVTPETEATIKKGLDWLTARQDPQVGNFGSRLAFGRYHKNPAVNGLCGLALLASGSSPGRGPYGAAIDKTIDYILSCATPTGFIVEEDTSYYEAPMYGHGFATLFLAEVYGMSPRREVRETLHRAVQLIVATQSSEGRNAGGWRYAPKPEHADISVTAAQVMALRAAHNAGVAVPRETIDRCVNYLEQCQNPDGGFRYQLLEGGESRFPRSAAALTALHNCGIHEGPVVERALAYLMQFRPGHAGLRERGYYFYAHYYAVQSAWFAGGDVWSQWYPAVRDDLLAMQLSNGSWPDQGIGAEYATAMSLLVLQVPNNYLPIFQR